MFLNLPSRHETDSYIRLDFVKLRMDNLQILLGKYVKLKHQL